MTENNKHWAGRVTFFLATALFLEKCFFTHFLPPTDMTQPWRWDSPRGSPLATSSSCSPSIHSHHLQDPLPWSPCFQHGRSTALHLLTTMVNLPKTHRDYNHPTPQLSMASRCPRINTDPRLGIQDFPQFPSHFLHLPSQCDMF